LITIGKAVSRHISGENCVKYYAQELKENTYNLTRMNLVMRGIIPQNIITRCADTLEDDWPVHEEGSDIDKPLAVDAVVSNPPYSLHWSNTNKENDPRFANYGLAPKTKADYAFLLHELHHLKADGILTIVLPHGVLFRGKTPKVYDAEGNLLPDDKREEGQAEGQIRANLIEKNNIDAIIGLPAGIFFGTEIPTIIMVLKKQKRTEDGVLIIDASKGFVKDGKQNKLRACDIRKIADTYRDRANIPGFSRVVSREEIRRNDYNLNIPRYVDSSESAEKFDIYSIMFGGIPNSEIDELSEYWQTFPSLRNEVFAEVDGKPYSTLRAGDVAAAILRNNDVAAYLNNYQQCFGTLRQVLYSRLVDHVETVKEMEAQDLISAHILARAERMPIIDKYHAYQILADKWQEIIGDIEIIQSEGVAACNVVEPKYKMVKDKNGLETEVQAGVKSRIFSFEMIQKQYFTEQLEAIKKLQAYIESNDAELNTLFENLDEDEQEVLLDDEKAKWSADAIKKATKEIITDLGFKGKAAKQQEQFLEYCFEDDSFEALLQTVVKLQDETKKIKKVIKELNDELESLTIEKIQGLTMLEINQLLELKWIKPIVTKIDALPGNMLLSLSEKITALNEKYATSFTDIENEIKASTNSLANMVNQLTGDEFSIIGLEKLIGKTQN
ncbi:MAG: N-6 DNA methylase, partial [Candidatus Limisoma sp.]|nr:N-6 DNA methylase [Candidatus Limisoma sp.]